MKLISFSPWQHSTTSIPQSSNADDIVQRFVGSSSKRTRVSGNQERNGKSVSPEQPDLILTSDHQISILGHAPSKKILKATGTVGTKTESIKELPQWIYTSRPGEQSAFFPKKSDKSKVGAIVDANSRSVFALQKNNTVLKIWSLDHDVTGPDEDEGSNLVDKIELSSAVVSIEAIPYKRQSRVKIKGQNSGVSAGQDDFHGGVIGSLANGQIFVVLISSQREVKVGFFSKDSSVSSTSRRKSSSKAPKVDDASDNHLFAVVGYASGGNTGNGGMKEVAGQKRKAESMVDDSLDNMGEITLTTLSLDPKKKGSIVFCKHAIALSSLASGDEHAITDTGDNSKYQGVSGVYSKEAGQLKLPHEVSIPTVNGNGSLQSHKPVQIAQLDPTHVGLVYETTDACFGTILDIRYGECIVQPFPLVFQSSSASVVDMAGLSTSIFAVLTSDNLLSIYDVRRAIVLHQINVGSVTGAEKGDSDYKYSIASDWFTGTIGIIRKSIAKNKNKKGAVHASFAKIGIFDAAAELQGSGTVSKPLLKGSYNLARAIASSMSTAASMTLGSFPAEVAPLEQNMLEWISPSSTMENDKDSSTVSIVTSLVERVDKCKHGQKNGKKDTLCKMLSDASKSFENGDIPQRVVDVCVASAVEIALSHNFAHSQKQDATEALMLCIKSGKFSGRNHLDKAINTSAKDVLCAILFTMKRAFDSESASKQNIHNSPLHMVFSLIRHCADALPEHMLVSMVHFILCHVSDEEFRSHWALSKEDEWYTDPTTKVLEKRLKGAVSKYKSNGPEEEKDLIQSLKNRLATSQKLFFVECIITQSKCNMALLREAMREGLTQGDKGEVEVLMQALSRLLRKAGKDKKATKRQESSSSNTSSCTSQWLCALVDANLGTLLNSRGGDDKFTSSIEATKKEVSATVSQTQALVNLKELLDHVQASLENKDSEENTRTMDVTPLPLYGIESLIF